MYGLLSKLNTADVSGPGWEPKLLNISLSAGFVVFGRTYISGSVVVFDDNFLSKNYTFSFLLSFDLDACKLPAN